MRRDSHLRTTRCQWLDTEHVVTQPSGRPGGPSMAEAMTETDITMGSEIAMQVEISNYLKVL